MYVCVVVVFTCVAAKSNLADVYVQNLFASQLCTYRPRDGACWWLWHRTACRNGKYTVDFRNGKLNWFWIGMKERLRCFDERPAKYLHRLLLSWLSAGKGLILGEPCSNNVHRTDCRNEWRMWQPLSPSIFYAFHKRKLLSLFLCFVYQGVYQLGCCILPVLFDDTRPLIRVPWLLWLLWFPMQKWNLRVYGELIRLSIYHARARTHTLST